MNRFGLSEIQANAILNMQLRRLQGLEREKIENELAELAEKIDTLDIGLIADNSVQSSDALGEPEDIIREAKDELNEILKQLDIILKELK